MKIRKFILAMTALAVLFVFGLALAADHSPPARADNVRTQTSTVSETNDFYSAPVTVTEREEIAAHIEVMTAAGLMTKAHQDAGARRLMN